jgi:hypothetical protein
MAWRDFQDLSEEEKKEVRSKSRAFIFFACILLTILGAGGVIEGLYTLTRDNDFIAEHFKIDPRRASTSSIMLLVIGAFALISAFGTIRLAAQPYRAAFFVVVVLALNRCVDTFVFHDTFFTFGSILTLIAASLTLWFLYLGRNAIDMES